MLRLYARSPMSPCAFRKPQNFKASKKNLGAAEHPRRFRAEFGRLSKALWKAIVLIYYLLFQGSFGKEEVTYCPGEWLRLLGITGCCLSLGIFPTQLFKVERLGCG
jgi:hypothetical protein